MNFHVLYFYRIIFSLVFLFCFRQGSFAQDSIPKKNIFLSGFPVIYYTPETRWAFGIAGVTTFRFPSDSASVKKSSFQLGFAYTQNNQVLFYLPYRLYFQNEKFLSFGELGYYKYNYFFFGMGNGQPKDFSENYGVNYPRVRINILRKILPNAYLGIKYWFEDFKIIERETKGELIVGNITGSSGGITSGAGAIFLCDTRDNIFYPSRGEYTEVSLQHFGKEIGSDFDYLRFTMDANKYFSFTKNQILAVNFFSETISGNPPFNQMALLGGTKRMRGYYEGRYRDRNILVLQTEYRVHLFWRLGAVVFAGYGGVADKIINYSISNFKYTYGGGLRFLLDKNQKINLRLDAAFGKETKGYYLTIGEAF